MRLLLVEDDVRLNATVRRGLQRAGFTVDAVELAGDARLAAATTAYDAIVLDLGLPDEDGKTVLTEWRNAGNTMPVLILTARDGVDDRVEGLNLGADDYLLKPFAMAELVARLKALLGRIPVAGRLDVALLRMDDIGRPGRRQFSNSSTTNYGQSCCSRWSSRFEFADCAQERLPTIR